MLLTQFIFFKHIFRWVYEKSELWHQASGIQTLRASIHLDYTSIHAIQNTDGEICVETFVWLYGSVSCVMRHKLKNRKT